LFVRIFEAEGESQRCLGQKGDPIVTLTASWIEITPIKAALGAVITGVDASRSAEPEVLLQLKQAMGRSPHPHLQKPDTMPAAVNYAIIL
jgi:hypothetical protein